MAGGRPRSSRGASESKAIFLVLFVFLLSICGTYLRTNITTLGIHKSFPNLEPEKSRQCKTTCAHTREMGGAPLARISRAGARAVACGVLWGRDGWRGVCALSLGLLSASRLLVNVVIHTCAGNDPQHTAVLPKKARRLYALRRTCCVRVRVPDLRSHATLDPCAHRAADPQPVACFFRCANSWALTHFLSRAK